LVAAENFVSMMTGFFIAVTLSMPEEINFNDNDWRKVDLPHDWSIETFLPDRQACPAQILLSTPML
jgi:hypothetical protein